MTLHGIYFRIELLLEMSMQGLILCYETMKACEEIISAISWSSSASKPSHLLHENDGSLHLWLLDIMAKHPHYCTTRLWFNSCTNQH
jgi:hypothetical protein